MSRTRIVNGKTFIHTEKSHLLYSGKSLIFSAQKNISEEGQKDGVIYGEDFEMEDLEKSSKSDLIKEAYWIDKESSNKTNLMNISSNEINFYIKLDKSTIGKTIKLTIRSLDLVFDDNISVESSFLVKKEEMFFKFNLNAENFQRGGDAIQKLYFLIEIDDEKYKYPLSKDDYLKVHVVHYIPQVMRAQNPSWEVAAKLQDRWFRNEGGYVAPNYADPVTDIVTMDWMFKFTRVHDTLKKIMRNTWRNPKALELLKKRLKEMYEGNKIDNKLVRDIELPKKRGEIKLFGSFDREKVVINNNGHRTVRLDKYFVNERVYESSIKNDPLDDMYGALANFNFRTAVRGTITALGGGFYKIVITHAAFYIKDSFDFEDSSVISQPLGFWDINNNIISKFNSLGTYYINNQSYKNYRKDYDKGGDYLIISDYYEIEDNFSFKIEEFEITGKA